MSENTFHDVGPDPSERCRHLRTKMMSVVVEWDEHAAEFPSTSAAYWCLKTLGPVGPDDGPASLDDCRLCRPCFLAQP